MTTTYQIQLLEEDSLLKIGFDQPATNSAIVREVEARLTELKTSGQLSGGPLIRVNGTASMPVAFTIAHHLIHLYETVAVFDPKMSGYIVTASHGPRYAVGDFIPESN